MKDMRKFLEGHDTVVHHVTPEGEKALRGSREPNDKELAYINQKYALVPLKKEDISIIPVYLANDEIDRDKEKFSTQTLRRFATTLKGKSFLLAHKWGPPGEARFFDAKVIEELGTQWLVGDIYVLNKYHEQLIDEINAGTWWAVSIGFKYALVVPVDKNGTDMDLQSDDFSYRDVGHWEYREAPEKGLESEAFEGSLVYLGAQFGAAMGHASKGACNIAHEDFKSTMSIQTPEAGTQDKKVSQDAENTMEKTVKTTNKEKGEANIMKYCGICGKELVEGKCPGGCTHEETPETPVEEPKTPTKQATKDNTPPEMSVGFDADALKTMEQIAGTVAMVGKGMEGIQEALKATNERINTQGEALKAVQTHLDNNTDRKGKAMDFTPDQGGFIKIPIKGSAMGALDATKEVGLDEHFRVDPLSGKVEEASIKKLYECHGMKMWDVEKDAKDRMGKQQTLSNIVTLLTTAYDRKYWDGLV